MKALFLTITLLASFIPALATADNYIYTGAWSTHLFSDGHDYNEQNDLLAIETENWFAGYFVNSFYDDSYALMYKPIELDRDNFKGIGIMEHLNLRVFFGGVYGYHNCAGVEVGHGEDKLCPMVVPAVSYTKYRIQPSVIVLGNAIAISVRWEL